MNYKASERMLCFDHSSMDHVKSGIDERVQKDQ